MRREHLPTPAAQDSTGSTSSTHRTVWPLFRTTRFSRYIALTRAVLCRGASFRFTPNINVSAQSTPGQ